MVLSIMVNPERRFVEVSLERPQVCLQVVRLCSHNYVVVFSATKDLDKLAGDMLRGNHQCVWCV